METQNQPHHRRGLAAIDGAMALITIFAGRANVIADGDLGILSGRASPSRLAGAIVSGVIFLICAGLYLFVRRVDADALETPREEDRRH